MATKGPAFQFYARDFLASTSEMSAAEVGVYIRALCIQWDKGAVADGDDARMARQFGVSLDEFSSVWPVVSGKFRRTRSGLVNARLEEERKKQAEYRRKQADKGKASGRARSRTVVEPRLNRGSSAVQTGSEPETNSPISNLQSPSADQERGEVAVAAPARQGPMGGSHTLIDGRAQRRHAEHASPATCAIGLCVHASLHDEFTRRLAVSGGKGPDGRELRFWYSDTAAAVQSAGTIVGDDLFDFWRNRFAAWVGTVSAKPQKPATAAQPRYEAEECHHEPRCLGQMAHATKCRIEAAKREQVPA